jgi:hypothetical protein
MSSFADYTTLTDNRWQPLATADTGMATAAGCHFSEIFHFDFGDSVGVAT